MVADNRSEAVVSFDTGSIRTPRGKRKRFFFKNIFQQ